jgi:hypothetical protein
VLEEHLDGLRQPENLTDKWDVFAFPVFQGFIGGQLRCLTFEPQITLEHQSIRKDGRSIR